MEEILTNAFSTGDIKIIVAAVIVYFVIYWQRNNTKKSRDEATESLQTRITLLENDSKLLHTQLDTVGNKLDRIIDQLCEIKVELAKKEEKK